MSSTIIIKLISDNSIYPDLQIQLTNSNSLIIGRNEQTKIKSTRCAKQQGLKSRISLYIESEPNSTRVLNNRY